MNENTRNTTIFIAIAAVIFLFYQFFVWGPATKRQAEEAKVRAAAAATATPGAPAAPGVLPAAPGGPRLLTREAALAASPRIIIDTPALTGSIALRGALFDDISLKQYRETTEPTSPLVELLRPAFGQNAYFVQSGWTGSNVPGLPDASTLWTAPAGATLSPGHPVVLTYRSGALAFTRTIEVDARGLMFTITDQVANYGPAPVTLTHYGSVTRQGVPTELGRNNIVHEGAVGYLAGQLQLLKYSDWKKKPLVEFPKEATALTTGGWLGITDKYWMAALIPAQTRQIHATATANNQQGVDVRSIGYAATADVIAPGRMVTETTRMFAGAKTVPVLRDYRDTLGIPLFDWAVDWGNFNVITRPMFALLEFLFHYIGNFGLAILALTVVVKVVFFPLANKSYESLTRMKKVQPDLEALRAKFKDDPAKQQQEMMALYQREKINPFMGCIPMLLQIPVFYGLYKVLTVTIEMRHAPFFGWIQDLSARDPTTIFNLFGALPFDPSLAPLIGTILNGPLHLGVLPLVYGASMWLSQSMSPTTGMDPMQQRMLQLMPVVLTFTLSQVAIGLLIYWTWNNLLSILQQYVIMHRFKVENPIDNLLARFSSKAQE